jgi:hypothetical protein
VPAIRRSSKGSLRAGPDTAGSYQGFRLIKRDGVRSKPLPVHSNSIQGCVSDNAPSNPDRHLGHAPSPVSDARHRTSGEIPNATGRHTVTPVPSSRSRSLRVGGFYHGDVVLVIPPQYAHSKATLPLRLRSPRTESILALSCPYLRNFPFHMPLPCLVGSGNGWLISCI